MSLVIPDELLKAARMSEAELMQEIVLMLFQQEKLTLGRASRLLGITQIEFQRLLASRKICVHYDVEDFRQDIKSLQERGWR
jgi:predicted HTH domain antitoxin